MLYYENLYIGFSFRELHQQIIELQKLFIFKNLIINIFLRFGLLDESRLFSIIHLTKFSIFQFLEPEMEEVCENRLDSEKNGLKLVFPTSFSFFSSLIFLERKRKMVRNNRLSYKS